MPRGRYAVLLVIEPPPGALGACVSLDNSDTRLAVSLWMWDQWAQINVPSAERIFGGDGSRFGSRKKGEEKSQSHVPSWGIEFKP